MEEARVIDITRNLIHELYRIDSLDLLSIPLFATYIAAGFPSPADDYLDDRISLGDFLVKNPDETFMMRVRGNSMQDANINDGDILIIDRSIKPSEGLVAACYLNDGWTVKTIRKRTGILYLEAANTAYSDIEVTEEMDLRIWGIITFVIHKVTNI